MRFATFLEILQATPSEGMGTTAENVKRFCRDDMEALSLLGQVTVEKQGNPTGVNQYTKDNGNRYKITESLQPERGTSRQYTLRRLRKSRPDLHEQVLTGDLSPHAAMKEAGFVKVQTPLSDE